jgi:hypothetical protein
MAEAPSKQTARAVFSDAARARLQHDEPITAVDPDTGIRLVYRPCECTLTLYDGTLGDAVEVMTCVEGDLEAAARGCLDRLTRLVP